MVTSFEPFKTTSYARLFLPCNRQEETVLAKQEILFNLSQYILYGAIRYNTMRIMQEYNQHYMKLFSIISTHFKKKICNYTRGNCAFSLPIGYISLFYS